MDADRGRRRQEFLIDEQTDKFRFLEENERVIPADEPPPPPAPPQPSDDDMDLDREIEYAFDGDDLGPRGPIGGDLD